MTKSLTLIIPADWPQQRRECHWFLHDDAGHILEQGCSEPAHWPGMAATPDDRPPSPGLSPHGLRDDRPAIEREPLRCDVLLAGAQVSAHRVQLPKTALGRTPAVLAVALEDSLLEDAEHVLFATKDAPGTAEDGKVTVGVVAKVRVSAICQLLKELGFLPRSAWPLGFVLSGGAARLCGGELTVALPDGGFLALDGDARLGTWLDTLNPLLANAWPLPYALLDQQLSPDCEAALREAEACGRLRRTFAADQALTVPVGGGFLYGELAPPRRRVALTRHFRLAARLGVGFAIATVLLSAFQWGWFGWQARTHRQNIEYSFRQAFPQGAMVDPLLQLQRQVDGARRAAGHLASDDFLRLLEPLGAMADSALKVEELSYENGRLRAALLLSTDGVQRLTEQCYRAGVTLAIVTQEARADGRALNVMLSAGEKP